MNIRIPVFNETEYCNEKINETSEVFIIFSADSNLFASYCKFFEDEKFVKKEENNNINKKYTSFFKDKYGVFLNFYETLQELEIVIETDCNYFSYADKMSDEKVAPQITQVGLADFGMSYAIRLSDGRYIVIDGGRELRPDAISLFETLKKGSPYEKPIIAAWIMTHAHCDHYRCFNTFTNLFFNDVIVEKILINFPSSDLLYTAPDKARPYIKEDICFEDFNDAKHIKLMCENIEKYNAEIYMPHTGQIYKIGDAVCEFLSTIEDVRHITKNENSNSLIFKMELGGQTILWTGDASFSDSRLAEKYSHNLKADILQVPHHGFASGTFDGQIDCYNLISPRVCFLPVSEYNAYTAICPYKKGTRYLLENIEFDELITGPESQTITLPYVPLPYKKKEYTYKLADGLKKSGSTAWIFTGLNTSEKEDYIFNILNTTAIAVTVQIELYFEDKTKKINKILAVVDSTSLKEICIIDENDVERNSEYFNWHSFDVVEIPENQPFAVRFLSDEPIVVSHKKHKAAYEG